MVGNATVAAKAKGQRVGYVRVSTIDQNEERQLDGEQLDRIFIDKISGRDTNRPQLQEMLKYVRDGDTLIVHSMDRLGRNARDLDDLIKELTGKGVRVEFVKDHLTFTGGDNLMAELMLRIMAAVAEFERKLIKERPREGIEIAKRNGVYKGRNPKLDAAKLAEARERIAKGEKKGAVARDYKLSRQALHAYLVNERKVAQEAQSL